MESQLPLLCLFCLQDEVHALHRLVQVSSAYRFLSPESKNGKTSEEPWCLSAFICNRSNFYKVFWIDQWIDFPISSTLKLTPISELKAEIPPFFLPEKLLKTYFICFIFKKLTSAMEYLCRSSVTEISPLLCHGKKWFKVTVLVNKLISPCPDLETQVLSFCLLLLNLYCLNFQRFSCTLLVYILTCTSRCEDMQSCVSCVSDSSKMKWNGIIGHLVQFVWQSVNTLVRRTGAHQPDSNIIFQEIQNKLFLY